MQEEQPQRRSPVRFERAAVVKLGPILPGNGGGGAAEGAAVAGTGAVGAHADRLLRPVLDRATGRLQRLHGKVKAPTSIIPLPCGPRQFSTTSLSSTRGR